MPSNWHCHVGLDNGGKKATAVVLNNLTISELWQQVVKPWRLQIAFTAIFDGMSLTNFLSTLTKIQAAVNQG